MGKTQLAKKKEQQNEAPSTECICPEGCVVKESIDPTKPPSDAIYLSCTNNCANNRYIHAECMDKWEAKLCKLMSTASGRCSRWTDGQVRANLWNKKGYECTMHVCRCPCTGFLRREEIIDVAALVPQAPKTKPKAKLPKLETNSTTAALKNKTLTSSRPVEAAAQQKATLRTQRSVPSDYEEPEEKPAPRWFNEARAMFGSGDDEEEISAPSPGVPALPPAPDSVVQFPSLPIAAASGGERATGGAAATGYAWTAPTDSLLNTAEELASALHALIVKRSGPVAATDVTLLDLVQNRLGLSLQYELADSGGLLLWIRKQRNDDLCAIADKIMTQRIARDLGYIACSSGVSQTSSGSRGTSATTPSIKNPTASAMFPSVVPPARSCAISQRVPHPLPIYDISAHLKIDFDITYDAAYAIEGLKLYQIACKTMLK